MEIFHLTNKSIESVLKATLLLFLIISGNFLSETLGCRTQRLMGNMFIKHVLIIFTIYFTIDFTQIDGAAVNPFINIFKALMVWVLYNCFTHMNIIPTIIAVTLLMITFFISNYRQYINAKKNPEDVQKSRQTDDILKKTQRILLFLMVSTIVIGCLIYAIEKNREYRKRFNIFKFLFGVKKCKGYTPKHVKIWGSW